MTSDSDMGWLLDDLGEAELLALVDAVREPGTPWGRLSVVEVMRMLAAGEVFEGIYITVAERCQEGEVLLRLVRRNPWLLKHAPERLRGRGLCLEAVARDGEALRHVPEPLRDLEMCVLAERNVAWGWSALDHVPWPIRKEVRRVVHGGSWPWPSGWDVGNGDQPRP